MYIGRAMAQNSLVDAAHPVTSTRLESAVIQSLNLIDYLLNLLHPAQCLLGGG